MAIGEDVEDEAVVGEVEVGHMRVESVQRSRHR